jgi:hypothetical protein
MMRGGNGKLPDFIAVGPPRTATTWLHEALKEHVSLPTGVKETHFFSWNFAQGSSWYQSHFRDSPPGRPIGEICPDYFDRPESRERIARLIPRCRIICTLRDPVKRLYSNYRQIRCEGWIGAVSLEQALELHRKWSGPGNMFGASTYAPHLRGWRETFGARNVLVMLNDDLEKSPQDYLGQVCAFIGIPPIDLARSPVREQRVNAMMRAPRSARLAFGARKFRELLRRHRLYGLSEGFAPLWEFCSGGGAEFAPLDSATERRLREYFRPDVEALEKLLGRDLSVWK